MMNDAKTHASVESRASVLEHEFACMNVWRCADAC
jgi:hypothetical protein